MYKKIQSLKELAELKLNTHKWIVPENVEELRSTIKEFKDCTCRTDSTIKTEHGLPFYILYDGLSDNYLKQLFESNKLAGRKMIITDGLKADEFLEFNFVCHLDRDCNYYIEACAANTPLRLMYNHHVMLITGNLRDKVKQSEIFNRDRNIKLHSIDKVLLDLFDNKLFDRVMEGSKYTRAVGTLNTDIAYWQAR